jgi:hypothetical protein
MKKLLFLLVVMAPQVVFAHQDTTWWEAFCTLSVL